MQDQGSILEKWVFYLRIYGTMPWGIMSKKSQGKRHLPRKLRCNPNHAPALNSKNCYKLTTVLKIPGSNNLQLHLLRTIFHCANLSSYFYQGARNISAQRSTTVLQSHGLAGPATSSQPSRQTKGWIWVACNPGQGPKLKALLPICSTWAASRPRMCEDRTEVWRPMTKTWSMS